jgi:hypothetical protein
MRENGLVISANQVAVPSGSAVSLMTVPAGFTCALSPAAGTIYVGNGTAVTSTTGAPVTAYSVLPPNPPTGAPAPLWAIAAAGTVPTGVFLGGPR